MLQENNNYKKIIQDSFCTIKCNIFLIKVSGSQLIAVSWSIIHFLETNFGGKLVNHTKIFKIYCRIVSLDFLHFRSHTTIRNFLERKMYSLYVSKYCAQPTILLPHFLSFRYGIFKESSEKGFRVILRKRMQELFLFCSCSVTVFSINTQFRLNLL